MPSKYTYQLQFGTGGYADLLPQNQIEMSGEWIQDTFIWREKMSNVRIDRLKNSTIYDTLESWFSDNTKFTTRIFIKILKSGVEDSIHWFGVKWGRLDKKRKTFEVEPLPYDYWSRYIEPNLNILPDPSTAGGSWALYDETGYYPYLAIDRGALSTSVEEMIKNSFSDKTGWAESNIVSSFLWQDDYEDGSTVGTYRGLPLDYVTGKQSFLSLAGINSSLGVTPKDVMTNFLQLFRAHLFFDSNDKLRIEHVSYFYDKIIDNAVDYSAYIKEYDEKYSYDTTTMPTSEKIETVIDDDVTDSDFTEVDIIYNDIRNRIDAQDFNYITNIRTLLETELSLGTNYIINENSLFSSFNSKAYKFYQGTANTLTSDLNYIDLTMDVGDYIESNDFVAGSGQVFTFTADLSINMSYVVEIVDRSSGAVISNSPTVNTGTTTQTLTLTTVLLTDDAYLRITGSGTSGFLTGWVALQGVVETQHIVIPTINGANTGNPKSNGAFSTANIVNDYWQDDRISRVGTIGTTSYTFDNTQYNLRRDTVSFYYASDINPLYGFNDGTRIGRIDKWTRNLTTGFYNIDILYQEDN